VLRERRRQLWLAGTVTILAIAVCAVPAAAGILDDVKDKFDLQTVTWTQNAIEVAKKIFVALVGTELAWSLIEIFLGTRELDGFIASITRRLIWVGAAIGVFTVAPGVVNNALYDFGTIGATISGYSFEQSSPDAVLHYGFNLGNALNPPPTLNPIKFTMLAAASLVAEASVNLAFAVAACALLLAWVEAYIVVSAGAFLLGFIGSRWTLPWAERYLGMVLAVATKLLVINLILGLGSNLGDDLVRAWSDTTAEHGVSDYFSMAAITVVYGLVVWFAPGFVANLVGVSPVLSASSVASVAGAVRGAASQVAGGFGSFGRAADAGAKNAVAAASAIRARIGK
jgi:P-type conjugative transfer protein TrbL